MFQFTLQSPHQAPNPLDRALRISSSLILSFSFKLFRQSRVSDIKNRQEWILFRKKSTITSESIDHTLGLPVSTQTLELKLRCAEAMKRRLRYQYTVLLAKSRAEPCMNAQALRKFVRESETSGEVCASGESVQQVGEQVLAL